MIEPEPINIDPIVTKFNLMLFGYLCYLTTKLILMWLGFDED